jgi:hypothetical protein
MRLWLVEIAFRVCNVVWGFSRWERLFIRGRCTGTVEVEERFKNTRYHVMVLKHQNLPPSYHNKDAQPTENSVTG